MELGELAEATPVNPASMYADIDDATTATKHAEAKERLIDKWNLGYAQQQS